MSGEQIKICETCCHSKNLPVIELALCSLHGPVGLRAVCPSYRYDVFQKPHPKRRALKSPLKKDGQNEMQTTKPPL